MKLVADYIATRKPRAQAWWRAARALAEHGKPRIAIHYRDGGIGDELLCSAILHELRRRNVDRVWMLARCPELFKNNPAARAVVKYDPRAERLVNLARGEILFPFYGRHIPGNWDMWRPLRVPVIAALCTLAGIRGEVAIRPYVYLTERERNLGRLADRQVAVQSSGAGSRYTILNKQWPSDRVQSVVKLLRGRFNFVQLGSPADPLLEGAADLRGKTSLRQSAAILSNSRFFVGAEGLLVHLGRAVDCRSVVIAGGRTPSYQYGYSCNEDVVKSPPCAPCWRDNTCDYGRICMDAIQPADVVEAVERVDSRLSSLVETDWFTIPNEWNDPACLESNLWA